MIINQVSEIPEAPAIPTNHFRKWVLKRRFSAELKKRRARQIGGDDPRPQTSFLTRRSLSDMSWATAREETDFFVKDLARSNTDAISSRKSELFLVRDILEQLKRRSLRRGDVVVPTKTQNTSPKFSSVELDVLELPCHASDSSSSTPEPRQESPENIRNLLPPADVSEHSLSDDAEVAPPPPVALERKFEPAPDPAPQRGKKHKAILKFESAPQIHVRSDSDISYRANHHHNGGHPEGIEEAARRASKSSNRSWFQQQNSRQSTNNSSITDPMSPPPMLADGMAKAASLKSITRHFKSSARNDNNNNSNNNNNNNNNNPNSGKIVPSDRRRKQSCGHSSLPDYTYHNKMPFKGLTHWVNRQVSVIGRIWNNHLDMDHYSYITHTYPVGEVDHDMGLPLSHYYISSGHNSYLTGNQVTSRCSARPIVSALKKGCRVIELDIWNDKKGPRVVHGFTMTKPTDLDKCIKAVRKYAFHRSEMPLIITLENHCNDANKAAVVQILSEELGELIYWTKEGRKSSVKYRSFPSPTTLKRRILIRDKDDTLSDAADEVRLSDRPSGMIEFDGLGELASLAEACLGTSSKFMTTSNNTNTTNTTNTTASNGNASSNHATGGGGLLHSRSGKGGFLELTKPGSRTSLRRSLRLALFGHTSKAVLEPRAVKQPKGLLDLISIINVKSSMVDEVEFAVSFSKSEAALGEMTIEPERYRKLTRKHLLRVYPHARRIDSSNYDPFAAWLLGAQIVAMNWQTPGVPMWVYKGFFLTNGGCGYVRKPNWMMSEEPMDVGEMPVTQMLSVQVLSARSMNHRFPQDNYVQVDLYGIPKDTSSYRTRTCRSIDACTWDDVIHMPVRCVELGVLLIMLRYKEVVTGHVAVPLSNLKQGIHVFPLLNKYCKPHVSRRNIALVLDIQLRPATGNLRKLLQGE